MAFKKRTVTGHIPQIDLHCLAPNRARASLTSRDLRGNSPPSESVWLWFSVNNLWLLTAKSRPVIQCTPEATKGSQPTGWRRTNGLAVRPYSRSGGEPGNTAKANDRPPIVVSRGASSGCWGGACWLRPTREPQMEVQLTGWRDRRWMSRRGPQVRGGTPALTVTQYQRTKGPHG